MGLRFRVMSFNIRHFWADDGENSWPGRSRALVGILKRYPAKIICFQEVNFPILDFLSQALPEYRMASDRENRGPRWEYRPVFVHREFRILEEETISLSKTPDVPSKSWGSNFVRQATRVLLDAATKAEGDQALDETTLAVYNTHLDFAEQTQLNQVRVIWNRIREKDWNRPVVLAGDFNSTSDQKAYLLLTGQKRGDRLGGDLKDAMNRPRANTYHGFGRETDRGCIDWVLYRGQGLTLDQPAQAIRDKPLGRFPSDHYPVLAGFELTTNERT